MQFLVTNKQWRFQYRCSKTFALFGGILFFLLWLYGPLLDLGCFFSFLIPYIFGGTPWTGDQPVARPPPTHRTIRTQNKRAHTSMPRVGFQHRSQRSSERRQFMPQTARPLWSAVGFSSQPKHTKSCSIIAGLSSLPLFPSMWNTHHRSSVALSPK
jgi:hypothetical protein